jgi:hypothetical protein
VNARLQEDQLQRLMNPRLGIVQDSKINWDKLVNHIQEHVRKLDLMSLFRKTFVALELILRSQPLRQHKTLWALESELNEA